MAVETLSSTYELDTRKKLIDKDCPRFLLLIFNFAFLPMIQDITREMDAEFKGYTVSVRIYVDIKTCPRNVRRIST